VEKLTTSNLQRVRTTSVSVRPLSSRQYTGAFTSQFTRLDRRAHKLMVVIKVYWMYA